MKPRAYGAAVTCFVAAALSFHNGDSLFGMIMFGFGLNIIGCAR